MAETATLPGTDPASVAAPAAPAAAPAADWRTGLPEDLKADPSLASFTDVSALAKSYIATKKLVGVKPQGLIDPGETASPEERAAYQGELRKRLGVPEKPGEYKIKRPDIAIDGGWDAAAEAQFLTTMHAVGAPPSVVQAAIDFYGQWERSRMAAATEEARGVEVKLRTEWGPNYDARVGRANRAISEFGGTDLEQALTNPASPLHAASRHPAMVRAWAAVGDALVEHGVMSGEGLQTLSQEESQARAAELRAELKALPEGHPRRETLVNEIIAVTRAGAR